jgi:diguanylate cyclase (GGDEF)-like protein/PAS domain S-box-containing protein
LHVSPVARMSLGLASLLLAGLLVADVFLGLIPNRERLRIEARVHTARNLAIQVSVLMAAKDATLVARTLDQAVRKETGIVSAAIRGADGTIAVQSGDHAKHWLPPPSGESTPEHVRVPLFLGENRLGDLELSFASSAPLGFWGWLQHHSLTLPLVLGLGGFVAFGFYLRRALQYLDPSAVIPERVRTAFDGFSEGVMVVDRAGRILLANAGFRRWMVPQDARLDGLTAQQLPWLKAALRRPPADYPWNQAMSTYANVKGEHLEFSAADGSAVRVVVNCAPIQDGDGRVRGCIATFDDVTETERINQQLLEVVGELHQSRQEIERQNEELKRLATRDPLTGCLNRRAFYEALDQLYVNARENGDKLSCIMTDIDHFKSFNDRYGHAIGDQVLRAVARTLFSGLRAMDLLCRYGGEEFCIILPGVGMEEAGSIAERLRGDIEARAASTVRSTQSLKITSSFGVATFAMNMADPSECIDQADQALYFAKQSGRNRVRTWAQLELERAKQQPKRA